VSEKLNACVFVDADYLFPSLQADVAELADAPDSKSGSRKGVWVRPPPSAKRLKNQGLGPKRSIKKNGVHNTKHNNGSEKGLELSWP
jgi:hypothetical protein